MAKITKSLLDSIKPPSDGRPLTKWDDALKGFGVRVMPSGKISFFVQGRCRGKSIKKNIGPYGVWAPDQAREMAKDMLRDMDRGVDVRAVEKAAAVAGVTLLQVMESYFEHRGLKASTMAEMRRHVTLALADWQHLPIKSITVAMVSKRYAEYKNGGLHGKAPAPKQAQAAMGTLRSLINFAMHEYYDAEGQPLITDNVVTRALYRKLPKAVERTRRIPDGNIGAVYAALWEWRETPFNDDTLSSIDLAIFLMLTGARRGETSSLKWSDVNLDEKWWHIADPKNGNEVWFPLSSEAIRLLTLRQQVRVNEHVFSSRSRTGHVGDPRATMERISKMAGTTISPHDLRRTFVQILVAQLRVEFVRAELLTNHIVKRVTAQNYLDTQHLQYLLPEAQLLSDWLVEQAKLAQSKLAAE